MLKRRLIAIAVLTLGLFFIFNLAKDTAGLWQKAEIVKKAQEKREEEEKKNQEFKRTLEFTQTDEFVEKQARDKLGLAKPGETVVILYSPEATQSVTPEALPNWEKWLKLFF